jgi:hypothetical protein
MRSIHIQVNTAAERDAALAAIEALAPEVRWASGSKPTEMISYPVPRTLIIDGDEMLHGSPGRTLDCVRWSALSAAELLAALRPQPEPESWPGPHVEEIPGGTTVIYRDGRLSVGSSTLTADSVRNLIVAYDKHHGRGRIQDLSR